MKGRRGEVRMSWRSRTLFLLFIVALLAPSAGQAACMDNLTCDWNYIYNDTTKNTLKAAKLDYHPKIAPSVTTRIDCREAGDGTTDLSCTSSCTYAYVYYVKTDGSKRIANPGASSSSLCEKVCNAMGVAVYYLSGGPL